MAKGRGRGGGVARALALGLGLCLAAAATVALLVTHDTAMLRLAVVGALWAFVLAAVAAPSRRADPEQSAATPGAEVELRRTYEIELEREVAARREYELQLEVYLRRELETGLREDVESLREEIQRLRGEVIDRLDGELRMERIETTRLIGGSLRALQDEARRLGIATGEFSRLSFDGPAFTVADAPAARPELPAGGMPSGPDDAVPPAYEPAYQPTRYEPSPLEPVAGGSTAYDPARYEPAAGGSTVYEPARYEPAVQRAAYDPRPGADEAIATYPTAPPPPGPTVPPELATGPPAEPSPRSAARRAAPEPTGVAAYSSDDELSRIFAGSGRPPPPRGPRAEESAAPRHRRHRDEDEPNEVLSRLLGRS